MVSLAAVENAINNLWPSYHHAVVSRPDPKKGEQIILVTNHLQCEREKLIAYFKEQGIAEICLPKEIKVLEQIPILAEGKPTLPLIHALTHSSPKNIKVIRETIIQGDLNNLNTVIDAIQEADSVNYTLKKAQEQTELALDALTILPPSIYQDALQKLTHFSLHRKY